MNNIIRANEPDYRDRLASKIPGAATEVKCKAGRIDILTPTELIELKTYSCWRDGIGQLLSYGIEYPHHQKRLHVIVPRSVNALKLLTDVKPVCDCVDIKLTWEREDENLVDVPIFCSADELYRYMMDLINAAKNGRLNYQAKVFLCDVLNKADWVPIRFNGPIDDLAVYRRGKSKIRYLKAYSSKGNKRWMNVSVRNHADAAILLMDPRIEMYENWDYEEDGEYIDDCICSSDL